MPDVCSAGELLSMALGAYGLGWLCCFAWMRTSADAVDEIDDNNDQGRAA